MLSILNQRGGTHNSCEDSFWVEETETEVYGGVFDGCSTGINSHWASQTMAYIFRMVRYRILCDESIIDVMCKLKELCELLKINPNTRLLSTCILFHYDKNTKILHTRCLGDGVLYINDIEYVIDQGNIPDYIGYQIYKSIEVNNEYLMKYPIVIYENVDRFIICSDGIQAIQENQYEASSVVWQELLLSPPKSENYLKRMWNILKNKKFTLSDDLTIVSYATT